VHPAPLYEFAAYVLIGGWLWWWGSKKRSAGAMVGQYLLLTGIVRFMVEFIRLNPKVLWGLTNAQLASAGSVFAGILLIGWAAKHPATGPDKAAKAKEKVA
jgi:phosphatidylglycerol:prolipoprotein diacylglycerol transferase